MAQGQDEDAIKKDGILEVLKAADAEIKQSQLLTPDRSQPDDDQAESNLKPPAKRVAPKSAKTKKAKKQKLSGDDFILSTNPQSLWDSNPLAREADDPDVQKPNFTEATCRAKAMKELRHSNADPKEVETIDEACKVFGHLQMSVAGNNKFLHRRMKTALLPHQLLGTAKMRLREKANVFPQGGLMCDMMGLGKTIQLLTNILNGRRDGQAGKDGMTLIVAPSAVIQVWMDQIADHVIDPPRHLGKRCVFSQSSSASYLGGNEYSHASAVEFLESYQIVLASYKEVMKSHPHDSPPDMTGDIDLDIHAENRWAQDLHQRTGPLHRIKWHRVILDEAHAMKNHNSRTSRACCALRAKHYWATSGTPFPNGISEAYPYFKLLRMPHTESFKLFKKHYLSEGQEVLDKELEKLMIRRTYDDKILGSKIVDLPPTHQETVRIKPKQTEATVYQWLASYFKEKIDGIRHRADLSEEEKREIILAMIQRLRHMVAHWMMVVDILGEVETNLVKELIKEFGQNLAESQVNRIMQYIQRLGIKHGKFSKTWQKKDKKRREIIKRRTSQWMEQGRPLPKALQKKEKRKGKPKFTVKDLLDARGTLLHSSKTEEVIKQIEKRLNIDPSRKFVVFTQSREMINVLAEWFKKKCWSYLRYHGGMKGQTRKNALKSFKKDPAIQILIVSMLAGGEGLNLTAASCVINLDLWWNKAKETQAYMRVVRIGQDKETDIVRIVLEHTIDMKIMAIQEEKQVAIDSAMNAGSKHAKKWSMDELVDLLEKDPGSCTSTSDFFDANVKVEPSPLDEDMDAEENEDIDDAGSDANDDANDDDNELDANEGSDEEPKNNSDEGSDDENGDDEDIDLEKDGRPEWALPIEVNNMDDYEDQFLNGQ